MYVLPGPRILTRKGCAAFLRGASIPLSVLAELLQALQCIHNSCYSRTTVVLWLRTLFGQDSAVFSGWWLFEGDPGLLPRNISMQSQKSVRQMVQHMALPFLQHFLWNLPQRAFWWDLFQGEAFLTNIQGRKGVSRALLKHLNNGRLGWVESRRLTG